MPALSRTNTRNNSRLIALSLGLTLLALGCVSIMVMSNLRDGHFQQNREYLEGTLNATVLGIGAWYQQIHGEAKLVASDHEIRHLAGRLLELDANRESLLEAPQQLALRNRFAEIMNHLGYRGFSIIRPDGINLAASRNAKLGTASLLLQQPHMFKDALEGQTLLTRPQPSDIPLPDQQGELQLALPTMFALTPLKRDDGQVFALLALRIDPVRHLFPILRRIRFGESGEAYIFDRNGLILSEIRFQQELEQQGRLPHGVAAFARLHTRVPASRTNRNPSLTQAVQAALRGHQGALEHAYQDYRGHEVLGATRWLEDYQYGMVVEIDTQEVMHEIIIGNFYILLMFVLSAGLMVLLAWRQVRREHTLAQKVALRTRQLRHEQRLLSAEAEKRRGAEQRISDLLQSVGEGVIGVDTAGRATFVNTAAAHLLGFADWQITGQPIWPLIGSDTADELKALCERSARTAQTLETSLSREDGSQLDVELTVSPISGSGPDSRVISFRDISDRKLVQASLTLADQVFENVNEGVLVTDIHGTILRANPAICEMTGYSVEELIGQNPRVFKSSLQDPLFYEAMHTALNEEGYWEGELINRRKDGTSYPVWESIVVFRDDNDIPRGQVAMVRDITEQKESQQHIHRLAYSDTLTGLANRQLFQDRLEHSTARCKRNDGMLGVLFLDLDGFKHVNDSLGHDAGDHLLKAVAQRLKRLIRQQDTISRFGGDEFAILIEDISSHDEIEPVAKKVVKALAEPFWVKKNKLHIGTSVGIAIYPNDGLSTTELLKHADTAMYQAKASGRGNYRYFDDQMAQKSSERLRLEQQLRDAIATNQFVLHYQALFDAEQTLRGAEALVRWEDSQRGLVSPIQFIPLAEETGLILPLGEWVIEQACWQMRQWIDQHADIDYISINISGSQIESGNLEALIQDMLKRYRLPPSALVLEVTETYVMQHIELASEVLGRLRKLGIAIAIDDFGTGHSSLSVLKELPADILKIDRAFVDGLPGDSHDMAIVHAIATLAKVVGLRLVAEGVETKQQFQFLAVEGCDLFQGYLFGRPEPPERLLQASQQRASA